MLGEALEQWRSDFYATVEERLSAFTKILDGVEADALELMEREEATAQGRRLLAEVLAAREGVAEGVRIFSRYRELSAESPTAAWGYLEAQLRLPESG